MINGHAMTKAKSNMAMLIAMALKLFNGLSRIMWSQHSSLAIVNEVAGITGIRLMEFFQPYERLKNLDLLGFYGVINWWRREKAVMFPGRWDRAWSVRMRKCHVAIAGSMSHPVQGETIPREYTWSSLPMQMSTLGIDFSSGYIAFRFI